MSNVMYNICPECLNLNSAIVWFIDEHHYEIVCRECAHEFESGRLPWERINEPMSFSNVLVESLIDDEEEIE